MDKLHTLRLQILFNKINCNIEKTCLNGGITVNRAIKTPFLRLYSHKIGFASF